MFNTPVEFLQQIAIKRGKILRGGIPDIEGAARAVIQSWNSGKIPYYTVPPESDFAKNRLEASIVSEWSEAFKLSEVMEFEKETVMKNLESFENPNILTYATVLPSEPMKAHDAFMNINRDDNDVLDDIIEEDPDIKTPKKSLEIRLLDLLRIRKKLLLPKKENLTRKK